MAEKLLILQHLHIWLQSRSSSTTLICLRYIGLTSQCLQKAGKKLHSELPSQFRAKSYSKHQLTFFFKSLFYSFNLNSQFKLDL